MSDRILFTCTTGRDAPERATLPFVAATVAATSGQDAIVVCTTDAVWLGTSGGCDGVEADGMPPLAELYRAFVDAGGTVWLCSACTKPRGITDAMCAPGTTIVGAAAVVEAIAGGATSISLS